MHMEIISPPPEGPCHQPAPEPSLSQKEVSMAAQGWPTELAELADDAGLLELLNAYTEVRERHRQAVGGGGDRDRIINLDGARRAAHNRVSQYLIDRGYAITLPEGREIALLCANALERLG